MAPSKQVSNVLTIYYEGQQTSHPQYQKLVVTRENLKYFIQSIQSYQDRKLHQERRKYDGLYACHVILLIEMSNLLLLQRILINGILWPK